MIKRRTLGRDHQDVAKSHRNIALLYFSQGIDDEALEMHGLDLHLRPWHRQQ
jgi:hypothetical protein